MIVDTSAIIAILKPEGDGPTIAAAIAASGTSAISASTYVECGVVIARQQRPELEAQLDPVLQMLGVEIVPFTPEQAQIARDAYQRFGKGSGHPAQLNFGDCMAYATAIDRAAPLLFKGNDFAQTDIKAVKL